MPHSLSEIPRDLVYDDEPVEAILYGELPAEPTAACIRPVEPNPLLLTVLIESKDSAAIDRFYREIVQQIEEGPPLSPTAAAGLAAVTRKLLPEWPRPLKGPLPSAALEFLECLWRTSRRNCDDALAEGTGNVLWEWYEYSRRPADARDVLSVLVEICELGGRPHQASLNRNQLAYQWLSEQDWNSARTTYERSCNLAAASESRRNFLIARIGWWSARFELESERIAETLCHEVSSLIPEITEQDIVMTLRKALVCLARAEALLGRLDSAVLRLDQALEIDRQKGAMFLPEDLALQARIREQLRSRPGASG